MVIKPELKFLTGKPSHRGLTFYTSFIFLYLLLLFQIQPAKAQREPYLSFDSDSAKLIFFRPQEFDDNIRGIQIQYDFTAILNKFDGADSTRMNFTISASSPVLNWNFVEFKMTDTVFKIFNPFRIYQEKNHKKWDNRFQMMIPLSLFQKFIEDNGHQFVFSFDDKVINATFEKKQIATLKDFALQIKLDLKP